MNKAPIYPYPVTYARENGELEQYRASFKTLAECKCAIDDAIFDNWDGMYFAKDSAKRVLKQFGHGSYGCTPYVYYLSIFPEVLCTRYCNRCSERLIKNDNCKKSNPNRDAS